MFFTLSHSVTCDSKSQLMTKSIYFLLVYKITVEFSYYVTVCCVQYSLCCASVCLFFTAQTVTNIPLYFLTVTINSIIRAVHYLHYYLQVRQLAAVLIRRKIQKSKQWNALTPDVRQG